MQSLRFESGVSPFDKLCHEARRIEGSGRFKHDTYLLAALVESGNAVRAVLIASAMTLVFITVTQKIAVKLAHMVLSQRNVFPRLEYLFHGIGITGNFLLIARAERFDSDIAQKLFNFAIGKTASFDARGRTYAFDGGEATKSGKTFWSQCAE